MASRKNNILEYFYKKHNHVWFCTAAILERTKEITPTVNREQYKEMIEDF